MGRHSGCSGLLKETGLDMHERWLSLGRVVVLSVCTLFRDAPSSRPSYLRPQHAFSLSPTFNLFPSASQPQPPSEQ